MNLLAETQRVQIAEMTKLHVGHVNQLNRLAALCKKNLQIGFQFVNQSISVDFY